MKYYIVKYSGPFGFIKPWTAVRDSETFSQQFLTPSLVAGIERKLFPELLAKPFSIYKIMRHRLAYDQMSAQQEQIQPRGWNTKRINKKNTVVRDYAVLVRNVLLNPVLHLAFEKKEDAEIAFGQHLCLARNEDILLPGEMLTATQEEFDSDAEKFAGYELVFEKNENSFLVGYNRFDDGRPMYGWLKVLGNPVKSF
ncbi:MAG: hypothetical protein H6560_20240 [Lewinellaceae bacterium]|nr:hypothetical protein [Lewinellaceae bacterium]